MDKVGKRRLLKLAEKLESLPREKFDFDRWVGEDWNGRAHECGTKACAMGHATTIRGLGLRVKKSPSGELFITDREAKDWWRTPGLETLESAARVFRISTMEARCLFVEGYKIPKKAVSPTAKRVAKSIRQFVRDKEHENQ